MLKNIKLSESLAVLASIDPASISPGSVNSSWVPATNFLSFLLVVQTGVLGAAATVDAKIQQATDVSGTGAKDLSPGKSITQIVKATGDNKQALLDFRAQDLDAVTFLADRGVTSEERRRVRRLVDLARRTQIVTGDEPTLVDDEPAPGGPR